MGNAGKGLEVVHTEVARRTETSTDLEPLAPFYGPTEAELIGLYTVEPVDSKASIPDERDNCFAGLLNRGSSQE